MDAPDGVPMHANTNLLGQNPAVLKVARASARLGANQYPTEFADGLCEALARHHRLPRASFIAGNGCDEIIDILVKTYCNAGDTLAYPVPAFVMYRWYGKVNLARVSEVPLTLKGRRFNLDIDALVAARAAVTIVASPNNPTGNAFPRRDLLDLVKRSKGIVAVDEAYADFCGQNLVPEIRRFPNLILLRTFSKAYGLAGLRIGYAVGNPTRIAAMYRAKPPFNVASFSEQVAIRALAERGFWEKSVRVLPRERERVMRRVEKLGVETFESDANFFLMRSAKALAGPLKAKGILVRDVQRHHPLLAGCVRVTVGGREVNERFLAALEAVL